MDDDEEEQLLPYDDKLLDPLFEQRICRTIEGKRCHGVIEDIEVGEVSREKLYLIRYDDGDLLFVDEDVARDALVDNAAKPKAKAKAKAEAKVKASGSKPRERSRSRSPPPTASQVTSGRLENDDLLTEVDVKYKPLIEFIDNPPPGGLKKFKQCVDDVKPHLKAALLIDEAVNECQKITQSLQHHELAKKIGNNAMVCAIVLYTFDLKLIKVPVPKPAQNFYHNLNEMLRKRDGEFLDKSHGYLYLLMTGLSRLPAASGIVYRGIRAKDTEAALKVMARGRRMHMSAFSSTSPKKSVAADFATGGGVILKYSLLDQQSKSRDIRKLSAFSEEEEILLLPNFHCMVIGIKRTTSHTVVELMEQIEEKVQVDW